MFPFRSGSGGFRTSCPGHDLHALDDDGHVLASGATGNLRASALPLPPGCGPTLWQNDEGYRSSYLADFPGWYRSGDAGVVDEAGDVWVMGRTDDIINVAGHRLSTGSMEEVLASHQDVAECAVIGAKDELKGQTPIGLVVLKNGVNRPHAEIERELVALVRERIGPVASFRDARVVPRLPKTRSGKILRASIRKIADGEASPVPPTIEDPTALEETRRRLARRALKRASFAAANRMTPSETTIAGTSRPASVRPAAAAFRTKVPARRASAPALLPLAPVRHAVAAPVAVIIAPAAAFGQDGRSQRQLVPGPTVTAAWVGAISAAAITRPRKAFMFLSFRRRPVARRVWFTGRSGWASRGVIEASSPHCLTRTHLLSADASWRIFGARAPTLQQKMLRHELSAIKF